MAGSPSPVPSDRREVAALIDRIRRGRAEIDRLVEAADPARLTRPGADGWSVKDYLAHLAAWEQSLAALLEGRDRFAAMGIDEDVARSRDFDRINATIHARHRDRPLSEILELSRQAHARVLALLERLSDADLALPYSHYQPHDAAANPAPVVGWIIGNTCDHYEEHLEPIRALLRDDA